MRARVPLEVGQIRDVRSPRDRIQKKIRLARIANLGSIPGHPTGWVEVTDPDGRRARTMQVKVLERCPVVDEQGRAAGEERSKPLVTEDAHDLRKRVETAEAEVAHMKEREAHFAKALAVADCGQYRADWDGAIQRVIDERDHLRLRVASLEAELRAVNDRLEGESVARLLAGGDL